MGAFFVQDMLSAILLLLVLIHWELIPSSELIRSEQKNCARSQPSLDFLQERLVQQRAEALSVMLRCTGCGSSIMFFVANTCRNVQYFMKTVINSRTLTEMSKPSLLSFLWMRVCWITSFGNGKCHQNPRLIEYPPMPLRQLLPNAVTIGIHGMM